jgi:hypothetical protein
MIVQRPELVDEPRREAGLASPAEAFPTGLPLRAVGIALLLVAAISFLTSYIEFVIYGTPLGSFAPPGNAILPLLLLALLLNPLLQRLNRRWSLPRRELIGIYVVLLATGTLASCQFAGWVVPVSTGPFYYATPENGWQKWFSLIPSWWRPNDYQDIRRFYEGPKMGEAIHWAVWWKPLLAWGPFVLVFYLTFLCLTILLRKAWIEHERLLFPLAQLPLEVTDESSGSLRHSRLLWLGVLLPTLVHSLNGLHYILPSLPSIPLRDFLPTALYFTTHPWTALLPLRLDVHFCLIGFAFLAGGDVAWSMWIFYLLYKGECLLGTAFDWTPGGDDHSLAGGTFPFIEAQLAGAMLMMVLLTLWTARAHLRGAVAKAFGRRPDLDDSDEPLSYRMALGGLMLGFVLLVLWCRAVGMPVWVAALTMLLALLFVLGMHRMMAEGGVNFLWAAQSSPNFLFYSLGGAGFLSAGSWLVLLTLPYFVWDFKGPVGPSSLEGFKLQREAGLRARSLTGLMAAGIALTILLSYWAMIYLVHTHGGGVALDSYRFVHVGQRPFMELMAVRSARSGFSWPKVSAILISSLLTWLLGWMRWRYLWWRLHPVGYAASLMWAMHYMWFSLFLGSTARWLLSRFGGLRLYRQARTFFLGLILGDFLMMGVWLLIDAVLGVRGFFIFGA